MCCLVVKFVVIYNIEIKMSNKCMYLRFNFYLTVEGGKSPFD